MKKVEMSKKDKILFRLETLEDALETTVAVLEKELRQAKRDIYTREHTSELLAMLMRANKPVEFAILVAQVMHIKQVIDKHHTSILKLENMRYKLLTESGYEVIDMGITTPFTSDINEKLNALMNYHSIELGLIPFGWEEDADKIRFATLSLVESKQEWNSDLDTWENVIYMHKDFAEIIETFHKVICVNVDQIEEFLIKSFGGTQVATFYL